MQQAKVLETWVGVFVALGMVALFFMAMQVSNLSDIKSDERNFRITARFANAGSLKVRAPVSMAGVRLGRVEAIHFDKDSYEAVVDMRIDSSYDTLPMDTTASILTQGLLGEQYIGLSPGGDTEYLKDGDVVDMTQSAMVLEEVISRFLFSKAEGGDSKPDKAVTDNEKEDLDEVSPPVPKASLNPNAADGRANEKAASKEPKTTPPSVIKPRHDAKQHAADKAEPKAAGSVSGRAVPLPSPPAKKASK